MVIGDFLSADHGTQWQVWGLPPLEIPAKDIHALLWVNFSPSVPAHGGKCMTLNSIDSLTICLPKQSGEDLLFFPRLCLPPFVVHILTADNVHH